MRCIADLAPKYGLGMGLNPYRPQKRRVADYIFVAAALVVCALLIVWAFFG